MAQCAPSEACPEDSRTRAATAELGLPMTENIASNPEPSMEMSLVNTIYTPPDGTDTGGGIDVPVSVASRVPELLCPAYTFT